MTTRITANTVSSSTSALTFEGPSSSTLTLKNLTDPSEAQDAATKNYVDIAANQSSTVVFSANPPNTSDYWALGEYSTIASAQTAAYTTDFSVRNNHVAILVNSITTGGTITITGTSLSESTAVPVSSDTEDIVVDTTSNQLYQSLKKWIEVTNISIGSTSGINYDVQLLGYYDMANTDATLASYRAEIRAGTTTATNLRLRIYTVNQTNAKTTIGLVEDINIDNTAGSFGEIVDNLRSGANDRSYTATAQLWPNDTTYVLKQGDFNTYFTSNENLITGSSNGGLMLRLSGELGNNNQGVSLYRVILNFI